MRAPSLLAQCLPGLVPQDRGNHSVSVISDRDLNLSSPAVEILPSKKAHPYKYAGENVDLQGISVFKGRVSVADIIGFSGSDMISSKVDGSLKSWENSIDLVNVLKHDIRDGQLSFRGKRVLELSCSYGIPGIFACLKGASIVHFQDLNAETIRCTTIPNVLANLELARDRQSRQPESPLTPSRQPLAPSVNFYAGEWEELPMVLSVLKNDVPEVPTGMSLSFSEEDFNDGCSSQDGSIIMGQDFSLRRSRKLSGSRAWERASEIDQGEGGYDVILLTEIPYSATSLKKLYALIKKCLRPPYGVLYLATKKNYVGFNSAARQLRSLVDDEGIFGVHLVKEMTDREDFLDLDDEIHINRVVFAPLGEGRDLQTSGKAISSDVEIVKNNNAPALLEVKISMGPASKNVIDLKNYNSLATDKEKAGLNIHAASLAPNLTFQQDVPSKLTSLTNTLLPPRDPYINT